MNEPKACAICGKPATKKKWSITADSDFAIGSLCAEHEKPFNGFLEAHGTVSSVEPETGEERPPKKRGRSYSFRPIDWKKPD